MRIDANDLRDRLLAAASVLTDFAQQEEVGSADRARLRGKAEGVRLALSYVEDAMRTSAPTLPGDLSGQISAACRRNGMGSPDAAETAAVVMAVFEEGGWRVSQVGESSAG